MVPGQKALGFFLGTDRKWTTRWRCGLAKENATRLSKVPKKQVQVEIATANSNQLSGEKGFCCSPEYKLLFAPHSNGNMNCFTLIHFFTLAELGYKLETIWQKQSSQKRQLRTLVLPDNFNCTQRTAPHAAKFGMWFPLLRGSTAILAVPLCRTRLHSGLVCSW